MLGQLPCKEKELPSAYVHARAVAMYHHMATRVKESCHLLTSKARAVSMYPAETHGNLTAWVCEEMGVWAK